MHVVMFSGGKDSTAMLLMMIEKKMQIDKIMCVDTTKEFPAMYDHIQRVQDYINREIEIIKIDFDYWFGDHVKTKGKNKGQIGYGWPDFRNRWCQVQDANRRRDVHVGVPGFAHKRGGWFFLVRLEESCRL